MKLTRVDEHTAQSPDAPRRRGGARAEQRRRSREKLVQAGRKIALEGEYLTASVDDIAKGAGLSRATYYLHFRSKEDLLTDILEDQTDRWETVFADILDKGLENRSAIIKWIANLVDFQKSTENLISLYYLQPSTYWAQRFHHRRLAVIRILAHKVKYLGLFNPDRSINVRRQTQLLLFLYQLEQAVASIAILGDAIDSDALVEEMAHQFLALKAA